MRRTIVVVIACVLVLALLPGCDVLEALKITPSPSPSPTPPPAKVIAFTDPVVEKMIRATLNKPEGPVTDQDMLKVWNFEFDNNDVKTYGGTIRTLDDLNWCVNLSSVVISDTVITDISALAGKRNLVEFRCTSRLGDYTPLLSHRGLQDVSLTGATDVFLQELARNCSSLKSVFLFRSEVSGVSLRILRDNHKLTELGLVNCDIKDISPLASFAGLSYLTLGLNQIEDISPLAGNEQLNYLDLSANRITDWTPLEGMAALKTLTVRDNPVTESPALDNLAKNGCMIYR